MDDFQTINDIVNESIRNSSYSTVIISSCVFIVYTLIIRLVDYFKAKAKDKPLLEMSKAMQEMGSNISKLNAVLAKTLNDAEKKEHRQCERVITLAFKSMGFKITQECTNVVAHNNIAKNKELIKENLQKVISTEYYRLYSTLSVYELHDVNIATKLKDEWIGEITDAVMTIIYDGQDAVVRISHLTDRINILMNDYSTYMLNKLF